MPLDIPLKMSGQLRWIYMSENSVKKSECKGRTILLIKEDIGGWLINVVLVI